MSPARPPEGANSLPEGPGRRPEGASMSLLEVSRLNSYYGDSHILFDVSLHVAKHEVVALLGRNGAGKSTTLKSLMGVVKPKNGSVKLDGVELAGQKSHSIARDRHATRPRGPPHLWQPQRRGKHHPRRIDCRQQMAA